MILEDKKRISSMSFMKRAYVCSKFAGDRDDNVRKARIYCRHLLKLGYSPYASHLLVSQFTDDDDPTDRELGMQAGLNYLVICDTFFAFFDTGKEDWSEGMTLEKNVAEALRIPIVKIFHAPEVCDAE